MRILHDPACAGYSAPGHVELPARVLDTAAYLRAQHAGWNWEIPPADVPDDAVLLRAHTPAHLHALRTPPPLGFDGDCPSYPNLDAHARRGAAAAVRAAELAMRHGGGPHEPVFSLMRPPGHHALADRPMGFCYLGNIAIAALHAREALGARRVAVWDFDAHHGNGTEAMLHGRDGCFFASIHQLPGWPGSGANSFDNIRNFPVPPDSPPELHLELLRASWQEILAFQPELLLVSAGFDAYAGDPITNMSLRCSKAVTAPSCPS
jgi:acetoin utilization deacetylase AcuC-like enzyme